MVYGFGYHAIVVSVVPKELARKVRICIYTYIGIYTFYPMGSNVQASCFQTTNLAQTMDLG